MPAEWEKHNATWLAWPHHKADWPGKFPTVKWSFLEIIRHITASETLRLLVKDKQIENEVKELCDLIALDHSKIEFFHIATNRGWMRDCGPIFVKNADSKNKNEKTLLDFKFNGWAKYANHKLDNQVPTLINKTLKHKIVQPMHKGKQVVLEGGSIDVDGKGLLLTTEECLQSPIQERNIGYTKADYAEVFNKYLGVEEVIWLKNGIEGDDTHGHVDDIARFAPNNVVVVAAESNKKDVNHKHLSENIKILKKYKQLNVVELPMPQKIWFEDYCLPASYANFLITNKRIITPVFNDVNDRIALNTLAEVFPKHEVVGINCSDLVLGLGTIHCLTQQEPA
jgi:agmatine deiminase